MQLEFPFIRDELLTHGIRYLEIVYSGGQGPPIYIGPSPSSFVTASVVTASEITWTSELEADFSAMYDG